MELTLIQKTEQALRIQTYLNQKWEYDLVPVAYSLFKKNQNPKSNGDYAEYSSQKNITSCNKSNLQLHKIEIACNPTTNFIKIDDEYFESKMQKCIFDSLERQIMSKFYEILKEANYDTNYDERYNRRYPYEYYANIISKISALHGKIESNLTMSPIIVLPSQSQGKFGFIAYFEFSLWVKKTEKRENTMKSLTEKILCTDVLNGNQLGRYEVDGSRCLTYRNGKIVEETGGEEVLITTTEDEVNWDEVLMEMLIKSVPESDKDRNIASERLNDPLCILKAQSHFEKKDVTLRCVVVHPSKYVNMPMYSFDIIQSELCPVDSAFFLPMSWFLGAHVLKKSETGIGLLNPDFVVRMNFTS
jgi:hypothetical protein